jgi:hypothetical protein
MHGRGYILFFERVGAISFFVVFQVEFFFSRFSISRKNYVEKRLDPFDVREVPKTQKYAKPGFLIPRS